MSRRPPSSRVQGTPSYRFPWRALLLWIGALVISSAVPPLFLWVMVAALFAFARWCWHLSHPTRKEKRAEEEARIRRKATWGF